MKAREKGRGQCTAIHRNSLQKQDVHRHRNQRCRDPRTFPFPDARRLPGNARQPGLVPVQEGGAAGGGKRGGANVGAHADEEEQAREQRDKVKDGGLEGGSAWVRRLADGVETCATRAWVLRRR